MVLASDPARNDLLLAGAAHDSELPVVTCER